MVVSTTTLGSSLGTGGMETKIIAAEIATGAGVTTVITSSKRPESMFDIIEYHNAMMTMNATTPTAETQPQPHSDTTTKDAPASVHRPPHTVFMPSTTPMRDLKAWTSHTLFPAGSVVIDTGAYRVLSRRESGGRLLAAGVIGVMGAFASGQAVRIVIPASGDHSVAATGSALVSASGGSSAHSSRPATPNHHLQLTSPSPLVSVSLSRSASFTDIDTAKAVAVAAAEQQFKDEDVIEVGRGLAMYNYAQICRVRGLNRFVFSFVPRSVVLRCSGCSMYLFFFTD